MEMRVNKKEKINNIKFLEIGLVLIGVIVSILGYYNISFNIAVIGISLVFLGNVVYSLEEFEKHFIFAFMQMTIFTFLIARPLIGMLRGMSWWNSTNQMPENVWFALFLVLLTEVALYLGANSIEILLQQKELGKRIKGCTLKRELQIISSVVFFITMIFYLIEQFEPFIVIGSGNYLAYYTEFQSRLPGIFHTIASFMKYSLCLFLATLPTKKNAYFVLILYVLSTIPSLFVGVRNPFVLSLLFGVSYFLFRDYLQDKKKWIGRIEKVLIMVGTPVILIFLTIYSYLRMGNSAKIINPLTAVANFFYGQGVTFDVLSIGYGYMPGIKMIRPCNYTFGGIIDYVYRGTLGQKIFHTEALTNYNSVFNAENSNSLSHVLSYLSLKDQYLEGKGRGSSYLLETYADFGIWGTIIFSLILGALLVYIVRIFGKNILIDTMILISLTNIFFIPRAEATGWLTFLVTIQFWVCIGGCYLMAFLFHKGKVLDKIYSKIQNRNRRNV